MDTQNQYALMEWTNDNNRIGIHHLKHVTVPQKPWNDFHTGDTGICKYPGHPGDWDFIIHGLGPSRDSLKGLLATLEGSKVKGSAGNNGDNVQTENERQNKNDINERGDNVQTENERQNKKDINEREDKVKTQKKKEVKKNGANNQTLVSLKEFQEIFAIPNKYGDSTKDWPHKTILLYKYSSNATTKYKDTPENIWQRIDNDPKNGGYIGEHAESIMIKKLTKIQQHLKKKQTDYEGGSYKGIDTIDVIISFSPCNEDPHCCSTKLCDLKDSLKRDVLELKATFFSTFPIHVDDATALMKKLNIKEKNEKEAKINIKITFATFYKHYKMKNMEGLKELLRNDIELDILTGDKWLNFFDVVGLDRKTKLPEGRENREKADIKIFAEL